MGNLLGVDLGTTFSAMATINNTGVTEIVLNDEGENITPSCVKIVDNDVVVGSRAKRKLGASEVISSFKREMGNPNKTYEVNGKSFTPTALSTLVLKKLYKEAQKRLGDISETIVTIPANFANEARDATITAAINAGLDVQHIINEPTAAALCYASEGKLGEGTYAVFDLGGGTFDISIVKHENFNIEVLTSNGVNKLGGDDFDRAIIKYVAKEYKKTVNEDLKAGHFTRNDAENVKKELTQTTKSLTDSGLMKSDIQITRKDFEEMISTYIAQVEMVCEATIKEAKLDKSNIDGVLLAGGSTRIPIVKSTVEKIFGNGKLIETENIDEVVARGAAVYALFKTDPVFLNEVQKERKKKIGVADVTNKFFGFISLDNAMKLVNTTLIKKNTKIPHSTTESFYTVGYNQRNIDCEVTESGGEEIDPEFVNIKKQIDLPLPPNRPAGMEIKVTYTFTVNQTMECSFVDVETGEHREIEIKFSKNKADNVENIEDFFVE